MKDARSRIEEKKKRNRCKRHDSNEMKRLTSMNMNEATSQEQFTLARGARKLSYPVVQIAMPNRDSKTDKTVKQACLTRYRVDLEAASAIQREKTHRDRAHGSTHAVTRTKHAGIAQGRFL